MCEYDVAGYYINQLDGAHETKRPDRERNFDVRLPTIYKWSHQNKHTTPKNVGHQQQTIEALRRPVIQNTVDLR